MTTEGSVGRAGPFYGCGGGSGFVFTMVKRAPAKTVILGGKKWKVRFQPVKDAWGICSAARREIIIHPDAEKHGKLRETFLHEATHAMLWMLDEECVKLFAHEVDEALEVLGM